MGGAVLRNRFKRRVRMAALQVLRESVVPEMEPFTLFVRMGRQVPKGQELPYPDILRLLRMALERVSRRGS